MCLATYAGTAQNWQQVGDFNRFVSGPLYNDTTTGLLFISGANRFNGTDTLDGFFTWDGTEFVSLGKGRSDCGNVGCGPALFLVRYNDDIYFSGPGLEKIDTVTLRGIGRWDGLQWSAGLLGLNEAVSATPFLDGYYLHEGNLYASGAFRTANGDTCNSVAYWDGTKWTGLDFPGDGFSQSVPRVHNILFYKGELYVAGNFYVFLDGEWIADIARYDGSQWHAVGGSIKGGLADIWDAIVYKDELYVCGYFRKADGNVGNKIMRWDGEQWKEVGEGVCSPSASARNMLIYNDKLLLGGIFDCVDNGLPVSNIAAWDGERWCSFGNSVFDNSISAMAKYQGTLYIGGGFTEIDGQPVKYFAKWVGDHSTDTCSALVVAAPEPEQAARYALNISPNPAHSIVTLALEGEIWGGKSVRLSIFNALGQEVWSAMSVSGREKVSLVGWPTGVYVARVELERGVRTEVFVKE